MVFLEELVKRNIIKQEQISEIIRISEEKYEGNIDEALIHFSVDQWKLLEVKSLIYNIPIKKIDAKSISGEILKYIPEDSAKIYRFVPLGVSDGVLEIGILDPENIQAVDALQFISSKIGMPFKIYLIPVYVYKQIIEMYQNLGGEVNQALSELDDMISLEDKDNKKEKNQTQEDSKNKEEKIVEDAPIIKIVAVILRHATEGGASDIHIENTGEKVKVRFRVDGVLHTSLVLPLNVYNGIVARIKILAKLRLDEKRKPQDGGFSAKIEGRKIDFRVSTMPSYYGEKIVMRILDKEKGVKSLKDLDLSLKDYNMLKGALEKPYGLILITGPTGSGKSTTLYAMLNELDKESDNIVSLEDPVEYQVTGINQSQVMPEIGYTFASGLRSILRQDPDIIMVGEIRDKETAQLAIQAALTGHLVFSTLHTNSAVGAIPRLVDMGIDPYLIAPTLILSMAQRLVPRIHPDSKKPIKIDTPTQIMLDKQFEDFPKEKFETLSFKDEIYEANPSDKSSSGTKGRIAVFEMFEIDKDIQKIILENPIEIELYKKVREKGFLTMKEDAIMKSMNGQVPFKEVYNL